MTFNKTTNGVDIWPLNVTNEYLQTKEHNDSTLLYLQTNTKPHIGYSLNYNHKILPPQQPCTTTNTTNYRLRLGFQNIQDKLYRTTSN